MLAGILVAAGDSKAESAIVPEQERFDQRLAEYGTWDQQFMPPIRLISTHSGSERLGRPTYINSFGI